MTRPKVVIPAVFKEAEHLEEILCLATLTANKSTSDKPLLIESTEWYTKVGECSKCPYCGDCLAMIINE